MKDTYQIQGGVIVQVSSALELVEAMRANNHMPSASITHYMADMAQRCEHYNGAIIRTTEPEHFVNDLLQYGLVQRK